MWKRNKIYFTYTASRIVGLFRIGFRYNGAVNSETPYIAVPHSLVTTSIRYSGITTLYRIFPTRAVLAAGKTADIPQAFAGDNGQGQYNL